MTENEAVENLQDMYDVASCRIKNGDTRGVIYIPPDKMDSFIVAITALKEIQQYREIGTVEECREAVEKQKPKKPLGGVDIAGNEYMICSYCSDIVEDGGWRADYCPDCGQAIKWDENLEGMEDGKTESN